MILPGYDSGPDAEDAPDCHKCGVLSMESMIDYATGNSQQRDARGISLYGGKRKPELIRIMVIACNLRMCCRHFWRQVTK